MDASAQRRRKGTSHEEESTIADFEGDRTGSLRAGAPLSADAEGSYHPGAEVRRDARHGLGRLRRDSPEHHLREWPVGGSASGARVYCGNWLYVVSHGSTRMSCL